MPAAIVSAIGLTGVAASVATAVINFGISMVINKVFAPDRPESSSSDREAQKDQGVDTRVSPDPSNKLPILYGENKVRGTVIMADMSSDNQKMAYILALGEGAINGTSQAYWDDKTITLDGDITTGLRSVTNAVDVDGNSQDFLNGNVKVRMYPAGGRCSEMESFSSVWNADASNRTLPNTPYVFIEVTYDRDAGVTSLGDLSFDITGKKIRTLTGGVASGSESYSNNPAECILDYLTDSVSGLGLSDSQVDLDSLQALKNFCDESVNYTTIAGATGTANRYTCNGALNTNSATNTNLKALLSSCQSTLSFTLGKFGVVINNVKSVTRNLGDDDIIGGISITDSGFDGLTNNLTLRYRSKNNNDKGDQVILESPESVKNFNEPLLETTADLSFTNNNVEAERTGTVMLNQSRQSITAKFVTTVKHLDLCSGDIISITNDTTGWNAKEFRVMSIVEQQNDIMTLEFTVLEYSEDMYDDITINERDVAPNTNLLDPQTITALSTSISDSSRVENGVPISSITISWTDIPYLDRVEVAYKKSADSDFIFQTTSGSSIRIDNLEPETDYDLKVRPFFALGNVGSYTTYSLTTAVLPSVTANDSISVQLFSDDSGDTFESDTDTKVISASVFVGGVLSTDHDSHTYHWEQDNQTVCVLANGNVVGTATVSVNTDSTACESAGGHWNGTSCQVSSGDATAFDDLSGTIKGCTVASSYRADSDHSGITTTTLTATDGFRYITVGAEDLDDIVSNFSCEVGNIT